MKVFNCVLGVFSIISAIFCIFYPGITFLNIGWIVSILLGIWGVCAIVDYALMRKKEDKLKYEAAMGVLGLVTGIAAAVISLLSLFMPQVQIILDVVILCIFAGWLIISGITSVTFSFQVKKAGFKSWILTLILGILVLLSGIYGIFHLIFVAKTIGLLIGILFMSYGVRLILSTFENNKLQ